MLINWQKSFGLKLVTSDTFHANIGIFTNICNGVGAKWAVKLGCLSSKTREIMMGVGDGVASVIMLTFTKMPGPHADTAWAVIG